VIGLEQKHLRVRVGVCEEEAGRLVARALD
jgi:hypothetical protein